MIKSSEKTTKSSATFDESPGLFLPRQEKSKPVDPQNSGKRQVMRMHAL
jgi:hypothetical protein